MEARIGLLPTLKASFNPEKLHLISAAVFLSFFNRIDRHLHGIIDVQALQFARYFYSPLNRFMKKFLFIVIAVSAIVSCKKAATDQQAEKTEKADSPPLVRTNLGVDVSACQPTDVPPITQYNGPTDPANQTSPGFGIYTTNDLYDRGWKDGYLDAQFYVDYYHYIGPGADVCGSSELKIGIRDVNSPGMIRYEPTTYVPQPGEDVLGPFVTYTGCQPNWTIKKCILHNEVESKTLLMQYAFNRNYPGRTQNQIDYDNGRYEGYNTGISFEPFSLAP